MPLRFPKPVNQVIVMLISIGGLALSGCAPPLPSTWQNDIPGVYAGDQSGFQEVIEFTPDGTFHHQVFRDSSSIHSETGKWRVSPGKPEIVVEPFTEFYHRVPRKFSADGMSFVFYHFWPIPDGKSFHMITASVDYEFRLVRQARGTADKPGE